MALEAELTSEEADLILNASTESLEAYEFYLRGNSRFNWGYVERDIRYSIQMFEEAVRLDPAFAAAYARLSRAHGDMYWFRHDRSQDRFQAGQDALEIAMEIAPDSPETLIAKGFYHYHLFLDYDAALDAFRRAGELRPNDPLVRAGMAYVQRRQGKLEDAAENLKQALRQDPYDGRYAHSLATTYLLLRRYEEAAPYFEQALRLAPQWPRPRAYASFLHLSAEGDAAGARAEIERGIRAGAIPTDDGLMLYAWVRADMFGGWFEEAIRRMEGEGWPTVESQFFYLPLPLLRGCFLRMQGDDSAALEEFSRARVWLEGEAIRNPTDDRVRSALGIAYAGLGRAEDATKALTGWKTWPKSMPWSVRMRRHSNRFRQSWPIPASIA
jgi:tetratricopeptide (TPR) repeat protein